MLTLVEKAQEAFDQTEAEELRRKIRKEQFTFEDFLDQLQEVKKMGPINQVLGMLPGIGAAPKYESSVAAGGPSFATSALRRSHSASPMIS